MTSPYPDIEALLVAWLKVELDLDRVYEGGPTDVPPDVSYIVPIVMVERFGGNDRVFSMDRPTVDIDCYTSDRTTTKALGERIRQLMRFSLTGKTLSSTTVITNVATVSAPTAAPFDNGQIRRVTAAYQLTAKSRL